MEKNSQNTKSGHTYAVGLQNLSGNYEAKKNV